MKSCVTQDHKIPGCCSSVQFSRSVVSNSLWPHGLQHPRPSCPSPSPRVYSHSCPLSRWCHQTIPSSVVPFSSHLQSFPASGSSQEGQFFTSGSHVPFSSRLQSFPASGSSQEGQFFTSGGQSIGVSASASVVPMNIQDWFPLGWTGWISLQSKGLPGVFSNTSSKASILRHFSKVTRNMLAFFPECVLLV